MSESDSENFYDSLEENEDLSTIVPLYTGETSKSNLDLKPRKREKPPKPVIFPKKTTRSYLTMYYRKMNRNVEKRPDTCRAECGKLSPHRDQELEEDLEGVETKCCSESEEEDFYQQFMVQEVKTPSDVVVPVKKTTPRRFCFKDTDSDRIKKLEQLQKRQSYGKKMSMKNRIELEEAKKIKQSKI